MLEGQLGNPTWFCSFSAAETRWTHLLKTLGKIVEKKDYTDDEIKQMTWEQKSDLIQKDPVTCARNFDHMVQLFSRDVLKSSVMPVGEIVDYFYRVEFQQRGSPHIHGLFWVNFCTIIIKVAKDISAIPRTELDTIHNPVGINVDSLTSFLFPDFFFEKMSRLLVC